ncbi:hypothetical protein C0Q70_11584 [Pomacea canaliculata]|uniref:VWFD domain-containing protein n=1 Tax=Pomacea canaliculata TaxID=400727 RepID=A0A2T7P6D8_POMCA|nr:hypothetical protein C0Q70_11584 [Pomacea canaliculata]
MISFAVLLFSALVFSAQAQFKCGLQRGKRITLFSGTMERLKFPCKYNAVRQQCGPYFINLTPGSDIRMDTGEYYEGTMWASIALIKTGQKWEGRTSVKIASKYINDTVTRRPFHTKNRGLDITSIATFEKNDEANSVSLREKNNVFTITFGAYQEGGLKNKVSGWEFVCNDPSAVLAPYPTQVCGNLTEDNLKAIRLELDFRQDNQVLMLNVFNDTSITQTDEDCKNVQREFVSASQADREAAMRECFPIVFYGKIYKPMIKDNFRPAKVLRNCVTFVVSGYTDDASCEYLAEALDDAARVSEKIAQKIQEKQCYPDFRRV